LLESFQLELCKHKQVWINFAFTEIGRMSEKEPRNHV